MFSGIYESRCRLTPEPINGTWELLPNYFKLCNVNDDKCPEGSYCGSPHLFNSSIKWNREEELGFIEFNYGITTFDDIFSSIFTVV